MMASEMNLNDTSAYPGNITQKIGIQMQAMFKPFSKVLPTPVSSQQRHINFPPSTSEAKGVSIQD